MDVQFAYLVDYPHFVPTLARWHFDAFGPLNPASSLEKHQTFLKRTLQKGAIPTTLIAFSGNALVGSASLVKHDLQDVMELTPWLAAVYVAPAYRERGLGSALVRRMVEEAKALGYKRLHLFTPDQEHFYAQLGWIKIEQMIYRGVDIVIMVIEMGSM
jgi:N-acetylglutamate synthase-like GNAT family acetyltransferase